MAGGSGKGHEHPVPATPPARQHCCVDDADGRKAAHPGLILEWQRRGEAWWALVTYLPEPGVVVTQWLTGDKLTPVG